MAIPETRTWDDSAEPTPTSVVVLAGGASTRMGKDKLSLAIDGVPLIEHCLRMVNQLGLPVIAAAGTKGAFYFDETDVVDPGWQLCIDGPGRGPAAGLLGAAKHAPHSALLAVASDMPFLSCELLLAVLAAAHTSKADLVMPVVKEGGGTRRHPLAAFYSTTALAALRQQVKAGDFSLQRLASNLSAKLCHDRPESPTRTSTLFLSAKDLGLSSAALELQLFNCNTPEDLLRARSLASQASFRQAPASRPKTPTSTS